MSKPMTQQTSAEKVIRPLDSWVYAKISVREIRGAALINHCQNSSQSPWIHPQDPEAFSSPVNVILS